MPAERKIHELLPWYLAGILDARLAEEYRAHLPSCDACRAEMSFLERLQAGLGEHGEAFLDDHPTADRLIASTRGELAGEDAAAVRKHLEICVTCSEEISWIVGEASYDAAPPAVGPSPGGVRWWGWASGIAAVLLLASLPIFLMSRGGREEIGAVHPHLIPSTERSAGSHTVELAPDEQTAWLIFDIDLRSDAFPFTFELRDANGKSVYRVANRGADFLADGYLYVDRVPPGSYSARVYESGGTEPVLSFAFEVVEP